MGTGAGITRNTFYVFSSQVVQKLVNVCFIAIAARVLGTSHYGQYVLVSTMVFTATAIANFGIRPMIIRLVSRDRERAKELLSNVLALRFVSAFAAYLVLLLFVRLAGYPPETQTLTCIGGIAILMNCMQDALDAILVAFERMKVLGLFVVLTALLFTSSGVAVLRLGLGLRWLFTVNILVDALVFFLSGAFIWLRLVKFRLAVDLAVVREVLVGCWPFFLVFIFGFMDTRVDILLLSIVPGPIDRQVAIGYYGPAHSILMTIILLPRSLNWALVPVISKKIYIEQDVVRDLVEKATKFVMIAISFPLILFTSLFSEPIVRLIFGDQFLPTATALAVLGWAYAFQALNLPSYSVLGSVKELRHYLPILIASFILNILLDVLLIPHFSFVGAALGSVIVVGAGFFARFYFLGKILDTKWSATWPYLRLFAVLGVTLGAAYLVRAYLHWALLAALVATMYALLLYASGAIARDEWLWASGLIARRFGLRTRTT